MFTVEVRNKPAGFLLAALFVFIVIPTVAAGDPVPRSPKRAGVKKTNHPLEPSVEQQKKDAPPPPAVEATAPAPVETPTVAPVATPAPAPLAGESPRVGWLNKSLIGKWWFWTAVGGVVVVAATAVVVGTQVHGAPAFPETGPGVVTSALVRF